MSAAERFMERYLSVWPRFDDARVLEVVHPEASIHHSGMDAPIRGADEGAYVRAIKALMPDARLTVANWAAAGDVVFVEYEISGSVGERQLSWTGIGRFVLEGDRAIDVIGRWDNLDLLAQLDGETSRAAFAEAAATLLAAGGA